MQYLTDELLSDLEKYLLAVSAPAQPQILFQLADISELSLDEIAKSKPETFRDKLFDMIKEKGLDEVEIYKRGNVSRQLFSRIRSEPDYHPTKSTVFSLAIGMGLNIAETAELLEIAGYAFSPANKADLIIQYFIHHQNYNIFAVNEALVKYGFPPL